MKKQTSCINVRFSDTDMFGHVNNAVYASYMEESRFAFFNEVLPDQGLHHSVILASLKLDYRAQTKYPQNGTLVATTWIQHIGNSSFTFYCVLTSEEGKLICEGTAVIVHFDFSAEKSLPLPQSVRDALQPYVED